MGRSHQVLWILLHKNLCWVFFFPPCHRLHLDPFHLGLAILSVSPPTSILYSSLSFSVPQRADSHVGFFAPCLLLGLGLESGKRERWVNIFPSPSLFQCDSDGYDFASWFQLPPGFRPSNSLPWYLKSRRVVRLKGW